MRLADWGLNDSRVLFELGLFQGLCKELGFNFSPNPSAFDHYDVAVVLHDVQLCASRSSSNRFRTHRWQKVAAWCSSARSLENRRLRFSGCATTLRFYRAPCLRSVHILSKTMLTRCRLMSHLWDVVQLTSICFEVSLVCYVQCRTLFSETPCRHRRSGCTNAGL